ncbi:hypothetical protein P9176_07785 [Bacillus velezensis]|uniref:hypothetical protein n=1 Tax=Bacillus velezensis TaxID=492670 RepID=UPI002DB83E71|nr:hypothetical protein [Bacillus velezensis]MEC3674318.1 hypothetical protein [Bacillus velezensis]
MNLNKWKEAVVNLKLLDDENQKQGVGSALYIKDGAKKYLFTVKHAFIDENTGRFFTQLSRYEKLNEYKQLTAGDKIIKDIDFNDNSYVVYEDDIPSLDLAILSLNNPKTKEFDKNLVAAGYKPIELKEIIVKEPKEGDKVTLVGYPLIPLYVEDLRNIDASLPFCTFGFVSANHIDMKCFMADIFNFPGFSGCPAIYKDKVVGFVGGQASTPIVDKSKQEIGEVRHSMAYIKKSSHILKLFQEFKKSEPN